jgi:hypothetical protein
LTERVLPVPNLAEEKREELAEIVARFIRLSQVAKRTTETYAKAFEVAYTITANYESQTTHNHVTREETVELAIELVERAKEKISKEA